MKRFSVGVNYWPINKAMYFWRSFDPGEISEDFARMSDMNLSPIRIFLLWEDFQPEPYRVSVPALERLAETARLADDHGLQLLVTLFTGHMSGANWFPEWMIDTESAGPVRFPLICGKSSVEREAKNPYKSDELKTAQEKLITEVTSVMKGHPALWGWDLGNEPSNAYRPENPEQARTWLQSMVEAIRKEDGKHPITIGLHQEDLEESRGMGPAEVAEFCDLLTMHAYPAYSGWSRNKTDPFFPVYLVELSRWLSGGKEVWMSEFGISTGSDPSSVDEESASHYAADVLEQLRLHGVPGALWWCYGDYAPPIWENPPFREKVHERSFGMIRNDQTPKGIASVLDKADRNASEAKPPLNWVDLDPESYWADPGFHIRRLYRNFLDHRLG
jgi:endo-1,4-beta-mannosidase